MNHYITLTMCYAPLDGPTFALRAPRVTAWSHLYRNYANKGDLTAIWRIYSQNRAWPYDLNPRGSNALVYIANHTNYRISQFLIQQGADTSLPNHTGIVGGEILWESSFAGRYGDEGISIVGSILKDIDYTERCDFTTLHKIMPGIIQGDLRSELETSTVFINQGDARKRTPLSWAVIRDDFEAVQALLAFEEKANGVCWPKGRLVEHCLNSLKGLHGPLWLASGSARPLDSANCKCIMWQLASLRKGDEIESWTLARELSIRLSEANRNFLFTFATCIWLWHSSSISSHLRRLLSQSRHVSNTVICGHSR